LLVAGKTAPAIGVFALNAREHPTSGDAFDGMGEAYHQAGDSKRAIDSYLKAVALDSTNTHAVKALEELKVSKKKIERARKGR
jgi:hypothetical protein